MSKFFITGVAGFIGSNLAEAILELGHTVVGVDNFLTGKPENMTSFKDDIQFVKGDIRDKDLMLKLCEGVDYVLHHAALASVPWSVKDPVLAHDHNVTGTLNVLMAAREQSVKRVVTAVTSAAYGDSDQLPSREDQPAILLSPYAATKLMCEHYLTLFSRLYGLPCTGLRYFNVFGPRQDPQSAYAAAIPIFTKKIMDNERPLIFGDGEQTRDFVYIEDVIQANLKACEAGSEADGKIFNIGTGSRVSVNDLMTQILTLQGSDIEPIHGDVRRGDAPHSLADITSARKILGYEPKFDMASGLKKAIGWYRDNL